MKNLKIGAAIMLLALTTHSGASAQQHSAMPTLARVVKIYTFNGKSHTSNNPTAPPTDIACSLSLGTVSFATSKTDTVGNQVWSDAVTATGCSKETFYGGEVGDYKADCRSNPGQKGDLFTWKAVDCYKAQLCPDGWRVPDTSDFKKLHVALGGENDLAATDGYFDTVVRDKLVDEWGASYGGFENTSLQGQGKYGIYWSQSGNETEGYMLSIHFGGTIYPQGISYKAFGYSVRCVRDK